MTKGRKVGRRARYGTRMPSTAITASAQELTFFMLMGEGVVSQGAQKSVERLAASDPEAQELMRQAIWMKDRAEVTLRESDSEEGSDRSEVKQTDLYRYITDHYWELVEEYAAEQGES